MISQTESSCCNCGVRQAVTTYGSINVKENPELKAQVLDGSAFVWQCPNCGAKNLVRSQTLYHDPDEKIMVWLTNGSEELEARVSAAYGGLPEMKDYTLRFVEDVGSLVEKVKIFDAGLDDKAMELTKYVTRMEVSSGLKDRADEIMAAPFRFLRLDGADGEITLAYPLDGQMQMVAVGFNVYEDSRGIIKRNPGMAESVSGFARVDERWVKSFFK